MFYGMAPFSQVSVKHRAAEFEKSLFNQESRRSLSILLGREQRFARWMLGNGVLNPRRQSFSSACPESSEQHRCSADYNVQQNTRIDKSPFCPNIGWCVLPNVQQFVSGETDCRDMTKDRTN